MPSGNYSQRKNLSDVQSENKFGHVPCLHPDLILWLVSSLHEKKRVACRQREAERQREGESD